MKIAVIDLGTNSVRFAIYEFKKDLTVNRIYRDKKMVRLGQKVFESNLLTTKALSERVLFGTDYYMTEREKKEPELYKLAKTHLSQWYQDIATKNVDKYLGL